MTEQPARWRYRVVKRPREAMSFPINVFLDEQGAEGWELVSAVVQDAEQVTFYFKRPMAPGDDPRRDHSETPEGGR